MPPAAAFRRLWWKHGVMYQIYPRSFCDSNGDGIGDIPGIMQKLDYLARLGIDGIWLSPIYVSPMHDFGYDISDYRDIDPVFGTMEDFDRLLEEAHRRGVRIIMDMVLNHTSCLHPWFIESCASRHSPKRDWYIWRDGSNGKPPNNWRSAFWGGAWEWHEKTGQFYLHSFLKEQPDLNWRNNDMKKAMFDMLRFWLDRGVDGFRLDMVNWLVKDDRFRNNPFSINPLSNGKEKYNRNRPENHGISAELRSLMDEYNDRMLVGEVFCYPPGDPAVSASYLGDGRKGLHLAFDFSLLYRRWDARRFYRCIRHWYDRIPAEGWPCNVLSNHDQPRSYNRYGGNADAWERARVAAVMLLTLRGTPFIYYGEEIGMKNVRIPRERIADPIGKIFWPLFAGRDRARTPMQWSPSRNAGFTDGDLWLPVCMDYETVNVEVQERDRYSLLNFYGRCIAVRRQYRALEAGSWKRVLRGTSGVIAYFREYDNQKIFVVLNFTGKGKTIRGGHRGQWKVLLSTHRFTNEHMVNLNMRLHPYEATIIERIGGLS
jgi:alpha-glucosidase